MPPTRTRPPQLLVASHNHGAGAELLHLAERRGYAVRRAHSGAQALEQAHATPPDLVVLKLDSDRARRETSIADAAGFYTVRGLALRAQELTLQAFHHAEPLACVALAPVTTDGQDAAAVDLLGEVLRGTGLRAGYDAVGNARYTPIEPKNLLSHATTALRAAKGQGGPNWIQGFAG